MIKSVTYVLGHPVSVTNYEYALKIFLAKNVMLDEMIEVHVRIWWNVYNSGTVFQFAFFYDVRVEFIR
jgi:hypothetical protein